MDISKCINDYINKLTKTIIGQTFSVRMNDKEWMLNLVKAVLAPEDSFLKRLVRFYTADLDICYSNNENKNLTLDLMKFVDISFKSDFKLESQIHEKILSNRAIELLGRCGDELSLHLNKTEALFVLNNLRDEIKAEILNELDKYNSESVLYLLYALADRLAIVSASLYLKMHGYIKGIENSLINDSTLFLLLESINDMSQEQLLIFSSIVGEQKSLINVLLNFSVESYNTNNNKMDNVLDIQLEKLLSRGYLLTIIDMYIQSNEILYEYGEFVQIENGHILQSGNFSEIMLKIQKEIVDSELDIENEIAKNIQHKYQKLEGFSSEGILVLCNVISQIQKNRSNQGQCMLETFPRKEFIKVLTKYGFTQEGSERLIDLITLDYKGNSSIDYNNRVSTYPLVKLKEDRILCSVGMLQQSYLRLNARMMSQSLAKNHRLQEYISKKCDEYLIGSIVNALQEKSVQTWEHVHLDRVKNEVVKELIGQKGITKEIDVVYRIENVLYFIEYKSWAVACHSIRDLFNEYKKVEKYVISHNKAIEIIDLNRNAFDEIFDINMSQISEIKLIMVFQNPNAFNYLNKRPNVISMTYNNLIEHIKRI